MYNRIKTLTLMQLGGKYSFRGITDKKKYALRIMFRALSVIAVIFAMYMLLSIIKGVIFLPTGRTTFLFLLFISQIISLLACTGGLMTALYYGKDNPILMSFPARHYEVFASKLLAYYIGELIKNLYFVFPMFLAFGFINGMGALYYVQSVILTALLSFIPVLLGAFLSILVMFARQLMKKTQWVGILLTVAVYALLVIAVEGILGGLERPIRLIEVYNNFVQQAVLFMQRFNGYALIYGNIVGAAFGDNVAVNYLILLGTIVGLAAVVILTSMPLYFRMASYGSEHAAVKKHKHGKEMKRRGIFGAFFRKESLIGARDINGLISDYLLTLALPLMLYLTNGFYWAMAPSVTGRNMIICFNIMLSLFLLTAGNTRSASAVSSEGGEFSLMKTAPADTAKMAWAKILGNFIVSVVVIAASMLTLGLVENVTGYDLWQTALTLLLVNGGHILWSFQLDLRNPQLQEYNEKKDGAENVNKSRALISGIVMAVLMGLVAVFFLMDGGGAWWRIIGIAAGFFALRLVLFVNNLKVYFREIEM